MKTILFSFILLSVLLLSGCGHNMVTYGNGIMLQTTVNPETYTVGLSIRYGKILTVALRENTKVSVDTETTESGVTESIYIETGDQLNGYYVDALKIENSKNL